MATPLVGFAEESYHGGSMVTISKSLPACFIWVSFSISNFLSSVWTLNDSGMHQNYLTLPTSFVTIESLTGVTYFSWVSPSTGPYSGLWEGSGWLLSSSSGSEFSSSKNCYSRLAICLLTWLSINLIFISSFGKLSMNTVSSCSSFSSCASSISVLCFRLNPFEDSLLFFFRDSSSSSEMCSGSRSSNGASSDSSSMPSC